MKKVDKNLKRIFYYFFNKFRKIIFGKLKKRNNSQAKFILIR